MAESQVVNLSRRCRIVRLSRFILTDLMKPGRHPAYEVVENPLPEDAVCTGIIDEVLTDCIKMRVQSEEFNEAIEGYPYPEHPTPMLRQFDERSVPRTVTLTRDDLANLIYDMDRTPTRRVELTVKADGAWEPKFPPTTP